MLNDVSVSARHHLLETNLYTKCPREPITGLNYDPRFYSGNGYKMSERTFLYENYIIPTLLDYAPGTEKDQNIPTSKQAEFNKL